MIQRWCKFEIAMPSGAASGRARKNERDLRDLRSAGWLDRSHWSRPFSAPLRIDELPLRAGHALHRAREHLAGLAHAPLRLELVRLEDGALHDAVADGEALGELPLGARARGGHARRPRHAEATE